MILSNIKLSPNERIPQEEAVIETLNNPLGLCLLKNYIELRQVLMDFEGVTKTKDLDINGTSLLQWQGQLLHDTFNLYPVDIEECIKRLTI